MPNALNAGYRFVSSNLWVDNTWGYIPRPCCFGYLLLWLQSVQILPHCNGEVMKDFANIQDVPPLGVQCSWREWCWRAIFFLGFLIGFDKSMSQLAVKCEVILSRRHHMSYISRTYPQLLNSNSPRKSIIIRQIALKNRDLANYKQKLRRKSEVSFKTRTLIEAISCRKFIVFVTNISIIADCLSEFRSRHKLNKITPSF